MTIYAIEGTGGTITFGTSNFTSNIKSMTLPERTRAVIDTTHLGTTVAKTHKPAKLQDVGVIQCEFDHNPGADDLSDNVVETITIKYPLGTGETVPAQLAFSGFVTKQGGEEFKVDAAMSTKVSIQVSGAITFTAAS